MWQNKNTIYGGFYDTIYSYEPSSRGNAVMMPPRNTGFNQRYGEGCACSSYNPRRLQPIEQVPTQQMLQRQYPPHRKGSQIRRLSCPTVRSAVYTTYPLDDTGSSCDSSFVDNALPAVAAPNSSPPPFYIPQTRRRLSGPQLNPLQRNLTVRNTNGLSTCGLSAPSAHGSFFLQQSHPQPNTPASRLDMQSSGGFRRGKSGHRARGFDNDPLNHFNAGFDSGLNGSFGGVGGLRRQYSKVGEDTDFYRYGSPAEAGGSSGGSAYNYGRKNSGSSTTNTKVAALQRGNSDGNSLYRMCSFSNPNNGDALNRGVSNCGSLYGSQNLYGDTGGSNRGGTSLYGAVSSGNLQETYSFAGSTAQSYGSEFALLDSATEENEFGGGNTTVDSWNTSTNTEYYIPKTASISLLPTTSPSIAPSISAVVPGFRPRSYSAPASRPTSQLQRSGSPLNERPGSGQRRQQRTQKGPKNEEGMPQIQKPGTVATAPTELPPVVPPPRQRPQQEEEVLVPIKRRASAPVNVTVASVTPFEQMRALRRFQTSALQSPESQPAVSSSMIGRRRGTSGGLLFSGAAVV